MTSDGGPVGPLAPVGPREPLEPQVPREPLEPHEPQVPREPLAPREPQEPREPRPMLERIGLAGIALVFAALFGSIGAAAWSGGEIFLGVMGGIGCFMTIWVGAITLLRG